MALLPHLSLFLLGVSSLFPLVNPIGTAIVLNPYFHGLNFEDRKKASATIAFYSFVMGTATLFLGSWILKGMGISIPTTQMAGGILIAMMGLSLLNAKSTNGADQGENKDLSSSLFYPMAFPLTLGPGGISTLITLSAHAHEDNLEHTLMSLTTLTLSLLTVCLITYVCYTYSDVVIRRIGRSGSLVVNRLSAFLVFCIGVQMFVSGLQKTFPQLLITS